MIINKVSLLPLEYKKRTEQIAKQKKTFNLLAVVSAVLIFIAIGTFIYKIKLENKIQLLDTEIKTTNQSISNLEKYQKIQDDFNLLKSKIIAIESGDDKWLTIISKINNLFPSTIKVTDFQTVSESSMCQMNCVASTYSQISEVIEIMENSGFVKEVKCSDIASNGEEVTFTLSLLLVSPQER